MTPPYIFSCRPFLGRLLSSTCAGAYVNITVKSPHTLLIPLSLVPWGMVRSYSDGVSSGNPQCSLLHSQASYASLRKAAGGIFRFRTPLPPSSHSKYSMAVLKSLLKCRMESFLREHSSGSSRNSEQLECQGCKKRISDIPCQCYSVQPIQDTETARTKFFNIPELLGLMFECCLPDDGIPTDHPLAPPRLLTHVCRAWRQTALATPSLWARLDLVCFPSIPCRLLTDRHCNILSDWLVRSGALPVSLALRYLGSSMNDVRNISKIFSTILPYSKRWRELSVTAPMPCLKPILQLLGHDTSALELCRITITSANTSSEREDLVVDLDNSISFRLFPITLDLSSSPNLRYVSLMADAQTDLICISLPISLQTLSLNNFNLLLGPPGLRLNFCCPNLRKLILRSNIQITILRQLSQAFPHLEDACLNTKHIFGLDLESQSETYASILNRNRSSIEFRKLHTLALRAVSINGEADLHALGVCLGVLNVPSLTRLSLTVSCAILQGTWTPLINHLAQVCRSLKELSFIGAYFSEDEFLPLLTEATQLEKLKICVRLTDGVLSALTLSESASAHGENKESRRVLCPRLTHLEIPLASPCPADAVIAMILSRCPPPPFLGFEGSQKSPVSTQVASPSRDSLQECRLVLSQPGTVELIEHHPDIIKCVERGLRLDLRAF